MYLTIIPRARIGYESIAHEAEGRMGYDSEAMRARGIIVLVKSNKLVKNIETKHLSLVKVDLKPFVPPKHYRCGGRFPLLMGYDI